MVDNPTCSKEGHRDVHLSPQPSQALEGECEMTSLIVGVLIATSSGLPPDVDPVEQYKPRFDFCNTRECDQRVAHKRHVRKVRAQQRAHKRAVRRRAMKRRYIQPYLGWLASVRSCESPTGVDSAPFNSKGDRFHGYYQFVLSTWRSVGGKGDPHKASWLEQSYRAVRLRLRTGTSPWPVCG
jgi:hypothetical protein